MTTGQTLKGFLADQRVDAHALEQATRYYLAERSGDLSPRQMKLEVVEAGVDEARLDEALESLEVDPAAIEQGCLAFLEAAWEEPGQEERIRAAVGEAKSKLPVIEIGILAMVAMYGMYLLATGGVQRSEETRKTSADGSSSERKVVEFVGPSGPLSKVVDLLAPLRQRSTQDD